MVNKSGTSQNQTEGPCPGDVGAVLWGCLRGRRASRVFPEACFRDVAGLRYWDKYAWHPPFFEDGETIVAEPEKREPVR